MADLVLGSMYSQIIIGETGIGLKGVVSNLGFLIQNVPGAMKKAEYYLLKTIAEAKRIGSDFMVSQACLDLGLAYKAKNKNDKALKFLADAKDGYQRMGADINIKRVEKILETIS